MTGFEKKKWQAKGIKGRKIRVLLLRVSAPGVGSWPENKPFKIPECQVIPPLGILYLASVLKKNFGKKLDVIVESLSTAVSTEEEISKFLSKIKPDIVGISAMSAEAGITAKVAGTAREILDGVFVVIGGPYPTFEPHRCLEKTGADMVVTGEAEGVICHLFDFIIKGGDPSKIPGIAFTHQGKFILTPRPPAVFPLDSLPLPSWEMVDLNLYSKMYNMNGIPLLKSPYAPILTSRGCPYRCSFCHNMMGRQFRPRSPENVVYEMEYLYRKFGIREFHIIDDIFNFDGKRVEAICKKIIKRGMDIAIAFPNGLRGDRFTKSQILLLKKAGCYSMCLSLESASPRILKMMRKNLNLKKLDENARFASSIGIITKCIFMAGYPDETREEMEETLRWIRDSGFILIQHSIACPLPGTEMARQAKMVNPLYDAGGGFTMDYNAVKNISRVSDDELKILLARGVSEIFSVPWRKKKLEEVRRMWSSKDERYFDWTIGDGMSGITGRGMKDGKIPVTELKEFAEKLILADEGLKGWEIFEILDSVVTFCGPRKEKVRIMVKEKDAPDESMACGFRYKISYLPDFPSQPSVVDSIIKAFRKVDIRKV